jgi:hydrogenase maturation protein HypF
LEIRGVVQGVGFRPCAHRLCRELGLAGWIQNGPHGARLELEGAPEQLAAFQEALPRSLPPGARIDALEAEALTPTGARELAIRPSDPGQGALEAEVRPDTAPCADCLRELEDPSDRRFDYPFLNCSHCGPRFTILEGVPYDRALTSMRAFPLCVDCRREYEDPSDRRFHAQAIACPACGPTLVLWDGEGRELGAGGQALAGAAAALLAGQVVALKGLGGFQLLADATSPAAVAAVRALKARPAKPLAVMVGDLARARRQVELSTEEAALLADPAAAVVLLRRRADASVCPDVAPGVPTLGLMLPSTPLHHLLLARVARPLVATSCNRRGEPILIDEREALDAFGADVSWFLVHDRPIANMADDSVVRWAADRPLWLRRARGCVPEPVSLGPRFRPSTPLLAYGGHLKATVALAARGRARVSQHLADLDSPASRSAHERVRERLLSLRAVTPEGAVCDLHPDYGSTALAQRDGLPLRQVQHHAAHVAAVLAEHDLSPPALGVAWDGSGYGDDGTVWGGEWLTIDVSGGTTRTATFRPFALIGGEAAVREPRRVALALLHQLGRDDALEGAFTDVERTGLTSMLSRDVRCPRTSSVGRLFDGVAALTGLCLRSAYEAQAAMRLEHAVPQGAELREAYPLAVEEGPVLQIDWRPALSALLDDVAADVATATIASRFHAFLVEALLTVAERLDASQVVLSGGCFQNRVLLEGAVLKLRAAGRAVHWPHALPPNDGALALGQLAVVALQEGG